MGSKWRKVKMALGSNMCLYASPRTSEDSNLSSNNNAPRLSDAVCPSPLLSPVDNSSGRRPMTPTSSSSGLWLARSGCKSSKKTCAICLTTMKPGQGNAIFTAECSHSFHFHCITSNVKHGNQLCPICRAKWKEIPFQNPTSNLSKEMPFNPGARTHNDSWSTLLPRQPPPQIDTNRHVPSLPHGSERGVFDDDELIDQQPEITERNTSREDSADRTFNGTIKVKTIPEVSAVPKSTSRSNFSVLVHIKAPLTSERQNSQGNQTTSPLVPQDSRAPVDLVTVLDISGSMVGTKLALLKRAMGFVIQNLSPSDRLSVISFSSTARRLFPLCRMTETGRQEALQAVNSLISDGGTNIAEGLRKGAKVLVERKWKNPVSSIILLSDGQDTYSVSSRDRSNSRIDYDSLIPMAIHHNNAVGFHVPVHSFGFGTDHDSTALHSIAEISGGTFSFIESESVIQDAFAQCIGGLLSVVVQNLQVLLECVHQSLQLGSIKAGSYQSSIMENSRMGCIYVGDLYAEEERDFLVTVNIPGDGSPSPDSETSLLKVKCIYRNPITKEMVTLAEASEVKIQRRDAMGELAVSLEVDRQRNRLYAAEAMSEARIAAEHGDLTGAVSILENCQRTLSESPSAQANDQLCVALCTELKEMQERMANRRVYEASGRAYVLSGLSSHSWQRATARGNSTESGSLVQAYQTPSMLHMLSRSKTLVFGTPSPQRTLWPARSFQVRSRP